MTPADLDLASVLFLAVFLGCLFALMAYDVFEVLVRCIYHRIDQWRYMRGLSNGGRGRS